MKNLKVFLCFFGQSKQQLNDTFKNSNKFNLLLCWFMWNLMIVEIQPTMKYFDDNDKIDIPKSFMLPMGPPGAKA